MLEVFHREGSPPTIFDRLGPRISLWVARPRGESTKLEKKWITNCQEQAIWLNTATTYQPR